MKKEAYEVEYYEPKSVLAMQADRREEKHRRKQKKGIRAGRILLGVAILLFWEVSARLGWIDDYYWSSPSLIAQTAIVQWKEKNLAYDIYFTSMSTIGGFLAGTLGGAVLGLSFWWSKTFAKIFEPYLVMFNAIPKLALAPILIVLFGIGFSSKVMLAFLMTVISCALATVSGVENVDERWKPYFILLGLPDGRCLEKSWFRQCFRGCLEAFGSIFHWRLREQSSANLSHRGTDLAEWSFMRELFWIPR